MPFILITEVNGSDGPTVPIAKRGRGRPRKEKVVTVKIPKKRGRPKGSKNKKLRNYIEESPLQYLEAERQAELERQERWASLGELPGLNFTELFHLRTLQKT